MISGVILIPFTPLQKLLRQWEHVSPHNGAQAMLVDGVLDPDLVESAWQSTLRDMGLGRVHVEEDEGYSHEIWSGDPPTPLVSHVKELGLMEAVAYNQVDCFAAGVAFARAEGIVPAPEANHAVKGAIEEALRCKREGKAETILFNLSGHGHFDMGAYHAYFSGQLKDEQYDEKELAQALSGLPAVPA